MRRSRCLPPPIRRFSESVSSDVAKAYNVSLTSLRGAARPTAVVGNETEARCPRRPPLDFGTIVKFIEEIFNLGNIPSGNYADYYANGDLGEFFQFKRLPRSFRSIQAPLGTEVFLDPSRPQDPPDND